MLKENSSNRNPGRTRVCKRERFIFWYARPDSNGRPTDSKLYFLINDIDSLLNFLKFRVLDSDEF